MRNRESIQNLISYFKTTQEKEIIFEEEAIFAAYQNNNESHSLIVKIAVVFGGILASIAGSGLLLLMGLYELEQGLILVGFLAIGVSVALSKSYDKLFIDTLSACCFIVGLVYIYLGLDHYNLDITTICSIFIVICLALMMFAQSYMLTFSSVIVINGSVIAVLLGYHNLSYLFDLYIALLCVAITALFLNEAKIITLHKNLSKIYNPVRIGLLLSFICVLVLLTRTGFISIRYDYIWAPSIIIICATIYLVCKLCNTLQIYQNKDKIIICLVTAIVLAPTISCPGIAGAVLIILLSFFVNYKTGFGAGILSFIYFLSQFYYALSFSLLTKSAFLFSSGLLFVAIYLFINKKLASK